MGDFSAVVELYRRARLSPRSRANLGAAPVALRNWGVNDGAARLGITHGALSLWLSRRQIPA